MICYLHKRLKQSSTSVAAQGCHGRMRSSITSDLLSLDCGFNSLDCRCDSLLLVINPLLQRCGKMWRAQGSYELNWSYFIKKMIGVQQRLPGAYTLSQVQVFVTLWTVALQTPVHGISQERGVGCHFLLQGLFPTQGSNLHLLQLLHCQVDFLLLCHLGIPVTLWLPLTRTVLHEHPLL